MHVCLPSSAARVQNLQCTFQSSGGQAAITFSPHLGLTSLTRCVLCCNSVSFLAGSKSLSSTKGSTSPFSSGVCTGENSDRLLLYSASGTASSF